MSENEHALTVLPFSTPVGLNLPPDFSIVAWAGYARAIKVWDCAGHFFLGDLMLYAENKGADFYGEAIQIVDQLEFAPKTLQNCMWIAKRFPADMRRFPAIEYSFYREVASLPNDEALSLLGRAVKEGWNTRTLGSEARRLKKNLHAEKGGDDNQPGPSASDYNARAVEVEASAAPPTVFEVKYGQPLVGSQNSIMAWHDGHSIGYETGLRKAIKIVWQFEGGNDGNDMRDVIIEALEAEIAKGALQDAEANARE